MQTELQSSEENSVHKVKARGVQKRKWKLKGNEANENNNNINITMPAPIPIRDISFKWFKEINTT